MNRPLPTVSRSVSIAAFGLLLALACPGPLSSRQAAGDDAPGDKPAAKAAPGEKPTPLNKKGTVLLDKKGKRLLLKTEVVLDQGMLELLCCLKQTKEHESILSLDAKAQEVHAALLALGANPGTPVRFNPKFEPPTGPKIDVFLNWTDEMGKAHRVPAQSWIRNAIHRFWAEKMDSLPKEIKLPENSDLKYDRKLKELSWYGPMTVEQKEQFLALSDDKAFRTAIESFFEQSQSREMKADWVFAGSGFYADEDSGRKYYLAEDGDLICVANFGSATIDIAVKSSAEGSDLMFEAWTEHIPPKGTPVTIELIPVLDAGKKSQGKK